ncbi:adipolin [Caerostris darwini]|uniref:Adipolin n=1 Tax=Caerostris darwini TaxID=1538125 RepID=A0AAV4THT7_9ARAC|nr:adipolin [Caerostris darwini]
MYLDCVFVLKICICFLQADYIWSVAKEGNKITKQQSLAAWNQIQKNSAREDRKRKKERKKATRHFRNTYMRSLMGPRGPRGPVGPPGPKGAIITKEEMMESFLNTVNDLIRRRHLELPHHNRTNTTEDKAETKVNQTKLDHLTLIAEDTVPKISTAFMWETKEFLYVPKQTKVEIDMFQKVEHEKHLVTSHCLQMTSIIRQMAISMMKDRKPSRQQAGFAYYPGSYNHGINRSNPMTGRFEAPRTGFYHLNAIFHVAFQNLPAYSYELFSLSIKICSSDNKTSLQAISGIGPSKRTTVAVSGVLHLKINEYVSVFIENSSQGNITIIEGTQFSGYLVGV